MTVNDVKLALANIAAHADDDEVAHALEDSLHRDVLAAIADRACDDAEQCAALALTSEDIKFSRWCA